MEAPGDGEARLGGLPHLPGASLSPESHGDTPHNDHLVTLRPDQLDQEETLSIRITR